MTIKPAKEISLFFLGIIIGLVVLVLFPYNSEVKSIIGYFIKFENKGIVDISEFNWVRKLILLIIVLFVGLVITRFFHIFSNSKNVNKLSAVISIFVYIFICIPVTYLIISMYAFVIYRSSDNAGLFIIVYAVSYSMIMRLNLFIFSQSYHNLLKKPFKNCRLFICEVTSKDEYDVAKVLLKRHTYEQCYTFMKNYTGEIGSKQFYQIAETSITGKIIDHWNYYPSCDVMVGSEEEFLTKIYSKEFANSISWGL